MEPSPLSLPGLSLESMMSSDARSYGFCGAIQGASKAAPTITTSITRPSMASFKAKKSDTKRRQADCS
ncbi:hypothetical protein G6F59_018913 [Rhizopus arrhizus]|nr:hypothetical protein G6F59_018913 [Rhizopus arrhizus]